MIYILVPVFRRLNDTKTFYKSLKIALPGGFMLILTDDSPSLEHMDYFQGFRDVLVVAGNGELYWGGGINSCIRVLSERYLIEPNDIVVFANNDIEVDLMAAEKLFSCFSAQQNNVIVHPALIDQSGNRVAAGSKILSWFPFITRHDFRYEDELIQVDLASARFLVMSVETLQMVGEINSRLPHYGGDNDFVLRAKSMGIPTLIVSSAVVYVDETDTGMKITTNLDFKEFINSFFTIKSPNAIRYRYNFVSSHLSPLVSCIVVFGMTLKSIAAYFYSLLRSKLHKLG